MKTLLLIILFALICALSSGCKKSNVTPTQKAVAIDSNVIGHTWNLFQITQDYGGTPVRQSFAGETWQITATQVCIIGRSSFNPNLPIGSNVATCSQSIVVFSYHGLRVRKVLSDTLVLYGRENGARTTYEFSR